MEAVNALGIMFEEGIGIPRDYNKSVAWYAKGASAGYADSMLNLGLMYKEGKGLGYFHYSYNRSSSK